MQLVGERNLPLPREIVWAALNDMEVLKACVPGCESITEMGEGKYEVSMLTAIGPIKARFKGTIQITEPIAPQGYSMLFEGSGGAAGFARGESRVSLTEINDENTLLAYSTEAKIGGKLAQIGARLVDSAARVMADRFFDAFVKTLVPEDGAVAEPVWSEGGEDKRANGIKGVWSRLRGA